MKYTKICGLKNLEDVQLCIKYGADAVGFIYDVPSSPRNLKKSELQQILDNISAPILTVIVSKPNNVNHIKEIMNEIKASYYQIHINFDIQEFNKLTDRMKKRIILALKLNNKNISDITTIINNYSDQFFGFLIDNSEGHGKKYNIELISKLKKKIKNDNLIIAGGINVSNVENIVKQINPFGIDVSSSLESSKGVKEASKIIDFLKKLYEIKKIKGVK